MPVDPKLRSLNIDVPAQPESLVNLAAAGRRGRQPAGSRRIITSDMALAAAGAERNSSLYGLSGRVQTMQQVVTYLGTREVARSPSRCLKRYELPPLPSSRRCGARQRARPADGSHRPGDRRRPWAAHSAGLFEECGKTVLFRHARSALRTRCAPPRTTRTCCCSEHDEFGVSHDAFGATALFCETWGLAAAAIQRAR